MKLAMVQAVENIRRAQEVAEPGEVTRLLNVALAALSYVVPEGEAAEFERVRNLPLMALSQEVVRRMA